MVDKLREKEDLMMIHPPKMIEYRLDCQNLSNDKRVEKALNNTSHLPVDIVNLVKPTTAFDFYGSYTRLNEY